MARPSKQPPVASSLVPAIVRHAAAVGVDVPLLCLRFGLPPDVARRDEVMVASDTPDELLHAVDRAARAPDVALRLAGELEARRHALVHLLAAAAPTAVHALGWLARACPLLHEGLVAEVETDDDPVRFVLRSPHRPRGVGRYVHELALAHALHHLREGIPDLAVTGVWFVHPRPADLTHVTVYFGTDDVAFGREDSGLSLAASEAVRPMIRADARTLETLAPLVEAELTRLPAGGSLTERVKGRLAVSLEGGAAMVDVARALHMSPRTLQRRLLQEGTQFTELLDVARLDQARRMLSDPATSLTEIAFALGFADLATFSRAFKRWTGAPPGQWRRI